MKLSKKRLNFIDGFLLILFSTLREIVVFILAFCVGIILMITGFGVIMGGINLMTNWLTIEQLFSLTIALGVIVGFISGIVCILSDLKEERNWN